jgi:Membrane-associated lipoprotein involved in thiamine biosynthesis
MNYNTVFYSLGTENSITSEENIDAEVLSRVVDRVFEIECKMSAFKPSSEISIITQHAGICPCTVSEDVYYILQKALELSRASDGAFDFTVRPLTRLWNFGNGADIVPDISEINAARALVGYQNLILDPQKRTAFLDTAGCAIDLGGIAKGYAANEAKRILTENNIESALINFGGNIMTLGNTAENALWRIGIQNPLSARGVSALTVEVSDKAVVTSAVNERFFIKDGIRYHHIIDPLTGYPAKSGLFSVSVIDGDSLIADALSTAVFVLGVEKGLELLRKYKSEAIFITKTGDILSTFELNLRP